MIAEILSSFKNDTLKFKIDYQIHKIESDVAKEIYNSSGDSIYEMYKNMMLMSSLNDRVKLPFVEIVLSSPVGEELSDDKFAEIAQEYLKSMGYENTCYSIIKNDDKDHKHVHILATTIDFEGNKVSDKHNWARSNKIMRDLEKKHGLQITEKGKSSHNKTLGESQFRQYFFDTAIHKALRSLNSKDQMVDLLKQSDNFVSLNLDLKTPYTNTEWSMILGKESYEKILQALSKSNFFNPLYKDELLSIMDHLYPECNDVKEFRDKLDNEGYYMRLVTNRGKSYYTYGIPDRGFYVKDSALPERYRYGNILFSGNKMTVDEQKHYLYNLIFGVLHGASGYEVFKDCLAENNIKLIEHANITDIYGISFVLTNVDAPEIFKSSDVSRRLTYNNIQEYFLTKQEPGHQQDQIHEQKQEQAANTGHDRSMPIEPVVISYANNRQEWESDIKYMYPALATSGLGLEGGSGKHHKEEEDLPKKKKKKRNNKDLSL